MRERRAREEMMKKRLIGLGFAAVLLAGTPALAADFSIGGNVNVNGDGGSSKGDLTAKGKVTSNGLAVTGDANFAGDIYVNGGSGSKPGNVTAVGTVSATGLIINGTSQVKDLGAATITADDLVANEEINAVEINVTRLIGTNNLIASGQVNVTNLDVTNEANIKNLANIKTLNVDYMKTGRTYATLTLETEDDDPNEASQSLGNWDMCFLAEVQFGGWNGKNKNDNAYCNIQKDGGNTYYAPGNLPTWTLIAYRNSKAVARTRCKARCLKFTQ